MTVRELLLKHLDDFRLKEDGDAFVVPFRPYDVMERFFWCGWKLARDSWEQGDISVPRRLRFERTYCGQLAAVDLIPEEVAQVRLVKVE